MEKFDKFEKLDRQIEQTIHEVENMNRHDFFEKFIHNSFMFAAVWACFLNLIIETLGRYSTVGIWGGLRFMVDEPLVFCYNSLIIFATILIASVFRRRTFVFLILSVFWLIIGIVNGVILMKRMTPFTVKDLSNLEDGFSIISNYMTPLTIALAAVGILLVVGGLVLLFVKGPRKQGKIKRKRNLVAVCLVIVMTFGATSFMVKIGQVDTFFGNLAYAYRDNGVVYSFINTWLNTGISKPSGYSSQMVQDVFDRDELDDDGRLLLTEADEDENYPNILFLQLESFIDPATVNYIETSEDVVPNFRALAEEFSSGELTVPACGAGTANVEFEVLSGLSVKFFGPGEYPYKAVLKDKPAESLAFDLKSLGYSTHAIHNHRGVFYNRNTVFANIGFDTFTSIEYMSDVVKTPKNWAKDRVLIENITDALKSTETRDMIYTISVQGHGQYPDEEVLTSPSIRVTKAPSEELKWKWEYYVNQIYEMDLFIRDLVLELEKFDEPVILAMYGDHIPAIDLTAEDLENGNLYGTEYVIWSNFDMPKEEEDLHTYQLTAHIMDMIDMEVGTVFTYQLNHRNSETYLQDLKTLGYDMLYGKYYIYGGKNPFTATDLQMGVNEIKITDVVKIGEKYYIKGENFNAYSKVTLNGRELDTIFLGKNVLGLLEEVDPEDVADMKVSQIEKKTNEILSTTE
ncbi:MAG: LTA synthase family protein [Firmicutes bacterium]|nr:LTA synthase family protein [Bacillota bacterium]